MCPNVRLCYCAEDYNFGRPPRWGQASTTSDYLRVRKFAAARHDNRTRILQLRSIDNNIKRRVFTTLVRQYTIDTHSHNLSYYGLIPAFTQLYLYRIYLVTPERDFLKVRTSIIIYIIYKVIAYIVYLAI